MNYCLNLLVAMLLATTPSANASDAQAAENLDKMIDPSLATMSLEDLLEIPAIELPKTPPPSGCTYECTVQLSSKDILSNRYRQADTFWVQVQTSANDRCSCPSADDVREHHSCVVGPDGKSGEVVLPCR